MTTSTSLIPAILGLSHLSLSVADRTAAQRFWAEVMGFECVAEEPSFCFMVERGTRLAVVLSDHDGTVCGPFDERRVGLDHLALAVPGREDLLTWAQRLTALGVRHSPIVETDGGFHLNLRAPDDVPVELFVINADFAAHLGLGDGVEAVAATHR